MKWQDIILIILAILSLIIGFLYLFGNSPTLEEALLIFMLTLMVKIYHDSIINKSETKNIKIISIAKKLLKEI